MKRIFKIFTLVLLLFCFSCKSNKNSLNEQKISINIFSEPQSLDPAKARDLISLNICKNLFDGLMRVSKEGVIDFALAKSFTISDDKKVYTFKLKDVTWSNKDPLDAYDFEYSFKRLST